ncbi:aldo/keto reductase [Frankia sp. R82]|uniref:aldo/keto reductase n=1 Tax=Frankia sp. R82 TaxID=2950553 RepID=UPI00204431B3|nr:aldo/keto reductase [Frankia sp. R82]MCM3886194.1 aldo/keto reductase [Frankia sp. R82]
MRQTTFGRTTGLRVSELALGAANFGTGWGAGAEPDEARRILERFAEAGGTFLDTAESYQFGESEEILGRLLTGQRAHFTLATKFGVGRTPDSGVLATGNGRRALVGAVEGSLTRLDTDYLDLLWVHFPDPVTPIEEIMRGLDDLVRSGKILYVGLSNFPAWRTARAATLAELRGLAPVTAVQFEYSLVERTADREVLPMAEALGLGAALWSPLGGGLLTGKYRTSSAGRLTDLGRVIHTEDEPRKTAVVDAVLDIAAELAVSPAQVATAWVRARADRSSTGLVPIIGPRSVAQLDDYLAALEVNLEEKQYQRLEEVSRIDLGQPHTVAAAQYPVTLGGTASASAFRTYLPVA